MDILSSLWTDVADGQFGIWMSALSGIAAALAVALAMTVYFRLSYRAWRDVVRHGLTTLAAAALFAFAAYDTRHAALAYLGLNPSKPAVEFEIRMPGKGTFEFRLRLPAEPHRTEQFGSWHLADRITSPLASGVTPRDAYTIRYRVL